MVDRHLVVAEKILSRLERRPLRFNEAWRLAVQDCAGVEKAESVLYWLRDRGYVRKQGYDHCAPYEITEKGRQLLAVLRA